MVGVMFAKSDRAGLAMPVVFECSCQFWKNRRHYNEKSEKDKQIRNPATHILFFFDRTLSCNYLSYVLQISPGISRNVSRLSLNDSRFTIHKFCVTDMHDPYVNQV